MATIDRSPATQRADPQGANHELRDQLSAWIDGEVRFDAGSRATYATDASNYRQAAIGVVLPASVDDGVRAIAICRQHDVPVLSRGGGTSLAGQCCNTAVVLDWTKYCHHVVSVDSEARTAIVQPGIVVDELNARLEPYGLKVGPKPSTHASCTVGGMIGNNSCGSTAQAYGKMADSVRGLEVLSYDGLRMWTGRTTEQDYRAIIEEGGRKAEIYARLRELRDRYLSEIRVRYPDIPRRVSGYNLDALLPEQRFHVARALVGSESTLVTVLHAEIELVPLPAASTMLVLGFPDVTDAADAVPAVTRHQPVALEGLDQRLIDLEHSRHLATRGARALPEGDGWLMAQFNGADQDEANREARALLDDLGGARGGPRRHRLPAARTGNP